MSGKVISGSILGLGIVHLGCTYASMNGMFMENHESESWMDDVVESVIGDGQVRKIERQESKDWLKGVTNFELGIYRGQQQRYVRVPEYYHENVIVETPFMTLKGQGNVVKYMKWIKSTNPVQLNHGTRYNDDHVAIEKVVQMTLLGSSKVINLSTNLYFDQDKKIIAHIDNVTGQGIPQNALLRNTRLLNGYLFSLLS